MTERYVAKYTVLRPVVEVAVWCDSRHVNSNHQPLNDSNHQPLNRALNNDSIFPLDKMFLFANCTNVRFENITINIIIRNDSLSYIFTSFCRGNWIHVFILICCDQGLNFLFVFKMYNWFWWSDRFFLLLQYFQFYYRSYILKLRVCSYWKPMKWLFIFSTVIICDEVILICCLFKNNNFSKFSCSHTFLEKKYKFLFFSEDVITVFSQKWISI